MMKFRLRIEKLEKVEKAASFTMHLLMLIILIGLSALAAKAQPITGVSYETVETFTYIGDRETQAYLPGVIFEFHGDKILASTKDQTKNLYMRYDWQKTVLNIQGDDVPGWVVEAYDNGGFKCLINYFYDPAVELYVIAILYNNINHVHFMNSTDKSARPPALVEMAPGDQMKRDYTDEEVRWFIDNYGFLMTDFSSLSWLN